MDAIPQALAETIGSLLRRGADIRPGSFDSTDDFRKYWKAHPLNTSTKT